MWLAAFSFVLTNFNYFIDLLVTLYTDRTTAIWKKFWIYKNCTDLTQNEILSEHLRENIIFEFLFKKSKIK